ncbi:hypothetical protein BU16DRAFT_617955 [Lophium mytilinum]|uniref:Uncharacterized protein n=1 Tax=Lophium mytilinum TaxID=390894 RepID=A0A6A6QSE6_9PEZI|nr:hypothetical protein BU16DRAFT_617955 [Lophium mytilinum]
MRVTVIIHLLTLLAPLAVAFPSFNDAATPVKRNLIPDPVRPFTVKAFVSPHPEGEGLSGYNLIARHGLFYLSKTGRSDFKCKPLHRDCGPDVVIFVTGQGEAFLDVLIPGIQQLYIDPASGALSYSPAPFSKFFPAAGITPFFTHMGSNPAGLVATDQNGTLRNSPATFNFIGSGYAANGYWFACKVPGGDDYQVFTYLTGFQFEDCESGIVLAALDFVGQPYIWEFLIYSSTIRHPPKKR